MKSVILSEISEDTLATLLEIISDGIWDWNTKTGYVYQNLGWFRMSKFEGSELENTVLTWEKIIHRNDLKRVMEHFDNNIYQIPNKLQYR